MQQEEKMLYEGWILEVVKYSFSAPSKPEFNETKNKINNCLEIVYYIQGHDVTDTGSNLLINTADTNRIAPPYNQTPEKTTHKSEAAAEIIDIAIITPHSFSDKSLVIDVSSHPKVKELFLKIYNIWSAKHSNYYFDAMSVYYSILKEIYSIIYQTELPDDKYNKLQKAIAYIHSNYSKKNFSCNILPELCGWKHAYFYKIFEKQFKTSPQKYTTALRMQLAVELLHSGKFTITEIADKCGYESVAYFSRVFKNYYTVPPTRYNRKI